MSGVLPLVEELIPAPDPLEACGWLADLPYLVFFDSAMTEAPLGQHSFLTADPATLVRSKGALTQQLSPASDAWLRVDGDPLTVVRHLLAPFASDPVPGLPPFQGGAAGYLGYDWGAMLERVPVPSTMTSTSPMSCLASTTG
jgi:para-aminobenzoate synthetase component 1